MSYLDKIELESEIERIEKRIDRLSIAVLGMAAIIFYLLNKL